MVIRNQRKFMVARMLPSIFSLHTFFILIWYCSSLVYICCSATDTIMFNSWISDERGETLVSAGKTFKLGFFTPNESSSSKARYVGIWYYNITPQTVVWVANRENPLFDGNGSFGITKDGNLTVLDGKGKVQWSTGSEFSNTTTAKLLDSGNFILSDDPWSWESFQNPTDTFLPGMIMDTSLELTSWKSLDDPAPGNFTFQKSQGTDDRFVTWKDSVKQYWIGESDQMPDYLLDLLSNLTSTPNPGGSARCGRDPNTAKRYTPCLTRPNHAQSFNPERMVMSFTGEIQFLSWNGNKNWSLIWLAPTDRCGEMNFCGKFGSCNVNNGFLCRCLPGFQPSSLENWESGDFSGGCLRKSQICSNRSETETFLSLKMMKVRQADRQLTEVANETECRKENCLGNGKCSCQAYSYDNTSDPAVCRIWTEDLTNLQEEYADDGLNISVRLYLSDIVSTSRDCETCGTNLIPYPLSTGPQCGDPMYSSFHCNISTGQLSFMVSNISYRVANIDPNERKLVIQAKDIAGNCKAGNSTLAKILQLKPPFHTNNSCIGDPSNSTSDMSFKSKEVELYWDPPLEPNCISPADCKDWPNSTCKLAQDGKKRCLCNAKSKFHWNRLNLTCTQDHEHPSPRKKAMSSIIAVIVIALIVVFCTIISFSYLQRRRVAKRRRNQMQHLDNSERHVKDLIDSDQFGEKDKKDIDVPFFDLKSIIVATDNFSDANKLGKGGFGPVYKGKFPGEREIAVKRLSNVSGQGLEEFKNEVILIAKLQHRNLVRLLGYCIKGEEKILLYEYMPNKSLDSFIFDRTLCMSLDWELRFNIILGIARGLLYLHQDSRLRIIHRDLKTSNILLDKEMNPKISDFGLARIFEGKPIELNTNRVVGTYGYMSPEYANYGSFSVKSDVFSFGVVVLEIISGKKVTGVYQFEQELSLLGYAWRLWNEDKALDLMDQTLSQSCNTNEFLKCANIGLLCVQEDPIDRPNMSNVVAMLDSATATISTPRQPAFTVRRDPCSTTSSSTKPEACSKNELTITAEEGR